MTETTDRTHSDQYDKPSSRSCPLCGDTIVDGQYPRHRLTLADEADDVENRRVNGRLCQTCWRTLYASLTDSDDIDTLGLTEGGDRIE